MNDEFYMDLAINKAWKYQILTYPNPAVGCVIVDRFGKILSIEAHQKAGSYHAELSAIISAFKSHFGISVAKEPDKAYEQILQTHNGFLHGAKAYVTLEPCSHYGKTPPCAKLLSELGFSEVIIGSQDTTANASGGAKILQNSGIKVKFGILKERCDELLAPFMAWQNGNFSFVKLGMSLNGVVSGGVITGKLSQTHMHKIRSILPLITIGGNTARIDRPRLDSRLADLENTHNPDVFIYSHSDKFDKTIPLFSVPNRKVIIGNDAKFIQTYPLCMVECGENLLSNLPKFIEYALIYFAPNFLNLPNLSANLSLKPLFLGQIGDEYYGWFKILRK